MKLKLNLSERIILLRLVDLICIGIGVVFANLFLQFKYINIYSEHKVLHIVVLFVLYTLVGQVFQMYHLRDSKDFYKTLRNLLITTLMCLIFYLAIPLITPPLPSNRQQILIFFLVVFSSVYFWRMGYIFLFPHKNLHRKVVFVAGSEQKIKEVYKTVDDQSGRNKIHSYVSVNALDGYEGHLDFKTVNLEEVVQQNQIREIVISLEGFSEENLEILNQKLVHYFELGINITSLEDYVEGITRCVPEQNLTKQFYKYFKISNSHENRLYMLFLRFVDLFSSVLGLSFMLILLPFIFIGNIFANRGSLFYSQKRVGQKGEEFYIYKFRSMVTSAEKNGAKWAVKNDNRVTTFGRFLRKSRIDEIPQFWNVLIGDMSLIGPRPERPEFVTELVKEIPLYSIRHAVKPGLTGWAQVMYPYAATKAEQLVKLRYDLYFIKKRDLLMDCRIVMKTINTVLYFKGQ